ncbi:MAG: hypothetical protein C4321_09000, partial [Chloroflexota bacterium]
LPPESALYVLVGGRCDEKFSSTGSFGNAAGSKTAVEWLTDALADAPRMQLGANYSTGQGWLRLRLSRKDNAGNLVS